MRKSYGLVVGVVLALRSLAQQDAQYNQYQFNQMVINPAYAGSRDALALVLDMRKQWTGFSGAPTTQSFSFHGPVLKKKLGLGFTAYADQIGPRKIAAAYGNIAYILKLNSRWKLSFGLRAGLVNYNVDWNAIVYKDNGDLSGAGYSTVRRNLFDMDAGIYLRSNSFYAGLSMTHLNNAQFYANSQLAGYTQAMDMDYRLENHLFLIVGKGFQINDQLVFNPSILLSAQGTMTSGDINLNFLIRQRLWLGAYYRSGNTPGALAQFYITDKLRIGYAFDYSAGKVLRRLGPTHELMIGFDFRTFKSRMVSPRLL